MTFKEACMKVYTESKQSKLIPYRTGRLKFHAMKGGFISDDTYHVEFDTKIAPYIEFLNEGTRPHDIPKAFGRPLPFGIGGRFAGRFHPGSFKHAGFIDKTALGYANRLADLLGGKLKW